MRVGRSSTLPQSKRRIAVQPSPDHHEMDISHALRFQRLPCAFSQSPSEWTWQIRGGQGEEE
jgi:hypothetical protein